MRSVQDGIDLAIKVGLAEVRVAEGSYSRSNRGLSQSTISSVKVEAPLAISGGWNATFSTVSGKSTLDAQLEAAHVVEIAASDVTMRDFVIQNGRAESGGGAGILVQNKQTLPSNVLLERLHVNTCESPSYGSTVEVVGTNITISNSVFEGNVSNGAGAIRMYVGPGNAILGVTARGNRGSEGAIVVSSGSETRIEDSTMVNNRGPCISVTGPALIKNNQCESNGSGPLLVVGVSANATDAEKLVINGNTFIAPEDNNFSAAIYESGELGGHTIINNRFKVSGFSGDEDRNIYADYPGQPGNRFLGGVPGTAVGLQVLNTPRHPLHDAATAYGNVGF